MPSARRDPKPSLVVFPDLVVKRRRGGVTIYNAAHGTHLECSPDVLEILRFFESPATKEAFFAAYEVDPSALEELTRHAILVDPAVLPITRGGMLHHPNPRHIGAKTTFFDLAATARGASFGIFGAPFELAVTCEGGTREGPRVIREAFPLEADAEGRFGDALFDIDRRERVTTSRLRVLDLGDVCGVPSEGIAVVGDRVRYVTGAIADAGLVPVMLGGDHALTLFALEAVLKRHPALGIVHLDAHTDLDGSVPWLNHANVFVKVLERREVKALRQIGVRCLHRFETFARPVRDRRLSWVTARELARGMTPAAVLRGLSRAIPYYLTFDVDCLDPGIAPETGAPVAGGLSLDTALAIVDEAARTLRIVGADFMEVAGSPARRNGAAVATARIVAEMLLARLPRKRLAPTYFAAR